MGDVTVQQLFAMVFGSVWGQAALFGITAVSIASEKSDTIKALPTKLAARWTAWRAGKTSTETPTQRTACENRRTTLIGIRHKSSELAAGDEREKALALCDEMDKLAARLWPEAA